MQNTEEKERIIVIPISKEAQERLDFDICKENDLLEYQLSKEEYIELEKINFFETLNHELNILIDDYEYEEILLDKFFLLQEFMNNFIKKYPKNRSLYKINEFFNTSYKLKTGLFFFF